MARRFCPASLAQTTIQNLEHPQSLHRTSEGEGITDSQPQLIPIKELGFIKQVKIVSLGDCGKIKRAQKLYNIAEVPELPLPGCNAPFCLCGYEPIIPNDV
jgi:hypothetical protein